MPLISVIVPVFNTELYLRKCIDSILKQTFSDIELILVDDGSSDNCPSICEEYAGLDKRVKVYHQSNKGPGAARNLGLKNAKGKYVTFVDSDDWIDAHTYDILKKYCADNFDIAVFGRFVVNGSNVIEGMCPYAYKECDSFEIIKTLLLNKESDFSQCDKIFNINLWRDVSFPEDVVIAEDVAVLPIPISKAKRCVMLPDRFYYYNYHLGSRSNVDSLDKWLAAEHSYRQMSLFVENKYPKLKIESRKLYFDILKRIVFIFQRIRYSEFKKYRSDYVKLRDLAANLYVDGCVEKVAEKKHIFDFIKGTLRIKYFISLPFRYFYRFIKKVIKRATH